MGVRWDPLKQAGVKSTTLTRKQENKKSPKVFCSSSRLITINHGQSRLITVITFYHDQSQSITIDHDHDVLPRSISQSRSSRSITINHDQSRSITVNPDQSRSITVGLDQSRSPRFITIPYDQSRSITINHDHHV
eukprot:994736-Amorphochlora_amoeboformis.AAC.1